MALGRVEAIDIALRWTLDVACLYATDAIAGAPLAATVLAVARKAP